jgi:cell wall-associated NlpC family hydrolase
VLAALPPAPVVVHAAWAPSLTATRVRALSVTGVPTAALVVVRCGGGGCRFAVKRVPTRGASKVTLTRAFKGTRLKPGAVIDIRVTTARAGGTLIRYTMRRGKPPTKQRVVLDPTGAPAPPGDPPPTAPSGGPAPPGGQTPATSTAAAALEVAKRYLGTPYHYGGNTPESGFDASGLMQYAYAQVGVQLPRVTYDQFLVGSAVELADLRAGDLVFFRDATGDIHHVGMAVGDGTFLHAPHTGDVIKYSSLSEPYYAYQFAGGRRVAD